MKRKFSIPTHGIMLLLSFCLTGQAWGLACTYEGTCSNTTPIPVPTAVSCPDDVAGSIQAEFSSPTAVRQLSSTRYADALMIAETLDDDSPCVAGPACDNYMVACDSADGSARLRRPGENDGLEYTCTLALDAETCRLLDFSHGDGPFGLGQLKDKMKSLLPPKPLGTGGAAAIDKYCLIVAHELGAHGSGKDCPNCKEEGEAYAAQKACLHEQYKAYCYTQTPECSILKGAIDSAGAAAGFQNCLCQAGTKCQQCEENCKKAMPGSDWCHRLACEYCKQ